MYISFIILVAHSDIIDRNDTELSLSIIGIKSEHNRIHFLSQYQSLEYLV